MVTDVLVARRVARPTTPALLRGPDHPRVPRALLTTLLSIAIALTGRRLYQSLATHDVELSEAVRYALGTTLVTYLFVGILLVLAVRRLRWDATPFGVALGLAVGCGLALVLLRGDVGGADPRLAVLVSEGSAVNVVATVLVAVLAAPLCEEVLFRGVLLESMEHASPRLAVWTSGVAFAAWHLSPSALLYYTLFGLLFGGLYVNRGLACSVAAHAAFNGVLVASAIAMAFTAGGTYTVSDLVVTAPRGWQVSDEGGGQHLHGPADAHLSVFVWGDEEVTPADALEVLLEAHGQQGYRMRHETARIESMAVGDVARVRVTRRGHAGEVAMLSVAGRSYILTYTSGGSARVRTDFEKILRDLRLAS